MDHYTQAALACQPTKTLLQWAFRPFGGSQSLLWVWTSHRSADKMERNFPSVRKESSLGSGIGY
jgi:hypothetical protein